MNVQVTFSVPAAAISAAQAVADGLANGHQGMFRSFAKDGGDMGGEGDTPTIYVSSGVIDDTSPMLADKASLQLALTDADPAVLQADIDTFYENVDVQLPGTGQIRLKQLDAYITSMEAQGFTVSWRDFDDDFGDDFA